MTIWRDLFTTRDCGSVDSNCFCSAHIFALALRRSHWIIWSYIFLAIVRPTSSQQHFSVIRIHINPTASEIQLLCLVLALCYGSVPGRFTSTGRRTQNAQTRTINIRKWFIMHSQRTHAHNDWATETLIHVYTAAHRCATSVQMVKIYLPPADSEFRAATVDCLVWNQRK